MRVTKEVLRGGQVLAAALFLTTLPRARASGVDEFIQKQMQARHVPGASIAVARAAI